MKAKTIPIRPHQICNLHSSEFLPGSAFGQNGTSVDQTHDYLQAGRAFAYDSGTPRPPGPSGVFPHGADIGLSWLTVMQCRRSPQAEGKHGVGAVQAPEGLRCGFSPCGRADAPYSPCKHSPAHRKRRPLDFLGRDDDRS